MITRKILTATVVALLFVGWGVVAAPPAPQAANQPANPNRAGTISLENCQTFWEDERVISSKIPGRIERRYVNDGQMVDKDEDLAQLDDREAQIELKAQEILGKSELDELVQFKKWVEYSTRFDVASRLVLPHAISEEEWRLAKVNAEVNELMTRKEAEKRQVEAYKADKAREFVDDHKILSPMRGIIKKCYKREKESVTPNDLQMFHIIATDSVWVQGNAKVKDMFRVKKGQSVIVKLAISKDGPPLPQEQLEFEGTIVFIDPSADFAGGDFMVRAQVNNKYDPENNEPILRAGLKANMEIDLKPPPKPGAEKN